MKPNLKRGVISRIVWALLLFACGGFFYYVQSQQTADKLFSQGYVYPQDWGTTERTTFQVKAMLKIPGQTDGDNQVYVVTNDRFTMVMLAKPDLPIIKTIEAAQVAGTLINEPVTLLAKGEEGRSTIIGDAYKYMMEQGPEALAARRPESKLLNATKAYQTFDTANMVVGALVVLGIASLGWAVLRYTQNKRFFDQLLVDFPELGQNDQALRKGAIYYEKHLGLYVYKDQLIVMGRKNHRVDLNDILYAYVLKQTTRVNLLAKSVSFMLKLHTRDFKALTFYPAKYSTKQTEDKLNRLMATLDERYPDMLVGVDHAPEYEGLRQAARR